MAAKPGITILPPVRPSGMRTRHQVLKGRGLLVSRSRREKYEVAFRFDVTMRVVEPVSEPPVEKQFEARGSVKTLDSVMLRNEHYDLYAPEGTYHVWRDEERWHIET